MLALGGDIRRENATLRYVPFSRLLMMLYTQSQQLQQPVLHCSSNTSRRRDSDVELLLRCSPTDYSNEDIYRTTVTDLYMISSNGLP